MVSVDGVEMAEQQHAARAGAGDPGVEVRGFARGRARRTFNLRRVATAPRTPRSPPLRRGGRPRARRPQPGPRAHARRAAISAAAWASAGSTPSQASQCLAVASGGVASLRAARAPPGGRARPRHGASSAPDRCLGELAVDRAVRILRSPRRLTSVGCMAARRSSRPRRPRPPAARRLRESCPRSGRAGIRCRRALVVGADPLDLLRLQHALDDPRGELGVLPRPFSPSVSGPRLRSSSSGTPTLPTSCTSAASLSSTARSGDQPGRARACRRGPLLARNARGSRDPWRRSRAASARSADERLRALEASARSVALSSLIDPGS